MFSILCDSVYYDTNRERQLQEGKRGQSDLGECPMKLLIFETWGVGFAACIGTDTQTQRVPLLFALPQLKFRN